MAKEDLLVFQGLIGQGFEILLIGTGVAGSLRLLIGRDQNYEFWVVQDPLRECW